MDFKYIQSILLMLINYVAGDLLQVSSAPINMTRVIKGITGITITGCYMECTRENGCQSIAITEGDPNQLPTCYMLKEDNGHYEGGENVLTTIQAIGSGPTVHGQWGCWTNSSCNASCGGGYLNKTRKCDSPEPQHGGDDCVGKGKRTTDCNTQPCPAEDGSWGAWRIDTSCSATCEGGTMTQKRLCDSPKPKHGGDDCVGKGERTIVCNTQPCPVHGSWGAWNITSFCNDGCNGGTFTKERLCNSPKPEHGGNDCVGHNVISLPCSTKDCPVVNIALNKPATQSGTFNGKKASNGNDGNENTYSRSWSYSGNSWWMVDLQAEVEIEYFILRGSVGNKEEVKVLGKTETGNFQTCKDPVSLKTGVAKFRCDSNRKFRIVKIEQNVQGYLYFNELEVYVKRS